MQRQVASVPHERQVSFWTALVHESLQRGRAEVHPREGVGQPATDLLATLEHASRVPIATSDTSANVALIRLNCWKYRPATAPPGAPASRLPVSASRNARTALRATWPT